MAAEIERKFLVMSDGWRHGVDRSSSIRQGYLAVTEAASVRVRIIDDAMAALTIKSAAPELSRHEFEYSLPLDDANALMRLCTGRIIEKRRHVVAIGAHRWEIDVFAGAHRGLVIAEIELTAPDDDFARPEWLGTEVTGDGRYLNSSLALKGPP